MNILIKSIVLNCNSSKTLHTDIPDLDMLIAENVPLVLRQSCLSWSYALTNSVLLSVNADMLYQFVYEKLLVWIEVMSLIGEYDTIGLILLQAISCVKVC